ncbi:MAG: hypothetical protein ACE15C_14395 [Phycisphaerae bacterium]
MPTVKVVRKADAIIVSNEYWEVRHNLKAGGCWDSIKFAHGSGRNMLVAPVSSRIRCLEPHPTSDNSSPYFYEEKNEPNPRVSIEETVAGPAVIAEGRYQLKSDPPKGADVPRELPIRYRRRYEYRDWGLVACELEIICEQERKDVVEVVAADICLRPGMTDALVREHPTVAGFSDMVGMGKWFSLGGAGRCPAYNNRFVPIHICCFEKGVEGLEFMPASDLSQWDTGLCPQAGMGYYAVGAAWEDPARTLISISPYCVAYRRNTTTLAGTHKLKYYIGLPFIKDAATVSSPYFHAGVDSRWPSDAGLERLARAGVRLLRFHNDYREDGPFWHDGQYPPYDEKGMAELRRIIATAHRLGMKIVPYISVKEFHPAAPDFAPNQKAWQKEQGPHFREVHTWYGSGEFGQLMCLESGWLEFRKKSIDIILNDLPWDGLYFDWCTPHPCTHEGHVGGALHIDQDAFLDFMFWCRKRVGPQGIIMSHLSGLPQIVIENMSDISLIYEDKYGLFQPSSPLEFPPQCLFVPISPRHLCGWGKPGAAARRCVMVCLLEGTPPIPGPLGMGNTDDYLAEFDLFGQEDLRQYRFSPASGGAVRTGRDGVYGALWYAAGKGLLYLANLSGKAARGGARFDAGLISPAKGKAAPVHVERASPGGAVKRIKLGPAAIRSEGIPYSLAADTSALFRLKA